MIVWFLVAYLVVALGICLWSMSDWGGAEAIAIVLLWPVVLPIALFVTAWEKIFERWS